MKRHVSQALRVKVAARAGFRCEYCLLPEVAAMFTFQIEHIISIQHGGETSLGNLAYACPVCNAKKGPNVGTVLEDEDMFVPFFHPRKHKWSEHFELENGKILPKTSIGAGTVKILDFNDFDRVLERLDLADAGLFDDVLA